MGFWLGRLPLSKRGRDLVGHRSNHRISSKTTTTSIAADHCRRVIYPILTEQQREDAGARQSVTTPHFVEVWVKNTFGGASGKLPPGRSRVPRAKILKRTPPPPAWLDEAGAPWRGGRAAAWPATACRAGVALACVMKVQAPVTGAAGVPLGYGLAGWRALAGAWRDRVRATARRARHGHGNGMGKAVTGAMASAGTAWPWRGERRAA